MALGAASTTSLNNSPSAPKGSALPEVTEEFERFSMAGLGGSLREDRRKAMCDQAQIMSGLRNLNGIRSPSSLIYKLMLRKFGAYRSTAECICG
jgi:hypothetical protein